MEKDIIPTKNIKAYVQLVNIKSTRKKTTTRMAPNKILPSRPSILFIYLNYLNTLFKYTPF